MHHSTSSVHSSFADAGIGLSTDEIGTMMYSPSDFHTNKESDDPYRALFLEGYLRGFRTVFLIGSDLAVLSFTVAWFLMSELSLKRDDDERLKREGEDKTLRNREE